MSRVEKFSISKNFPDSGVEPTKRMTAHIGRRGEGRVRTVEETSDSNPRTNPNREVAKRERPHDDKKIQIIFQWPPGSLGIKRY